MPPNLRFAAALALRSLKPVEPVRPQRAPMHEAQRDQTGPLESIFGVSLAEMREIADAVPQMRDQYNSKAKINPREIAESLGTAFKDTTPGEGEAYSYDTLPDFEATIRERQAARAGKSSHPLARIVSGRTDYGDHPEDLEPDPLPLRRRSTW